MSKCLKNTRIFVTIALLLTVVCTHSKSSQLPSVINRTFQYTKSITDKVYGTSTNVYSRYSLFTEQRNPLLLYVPSLYVVAKGDRQFIGETYSRVVFRDIDKYDAFRQVNVGTFPRYRRTMPTLVYFMTPNLYNVTLIQDHLLSPFHRKNARCYKYKAEALTDSTTRIVFKPKLRNTQLVHGEAVVFNETGRVISATFKGEYDMIHFTLTANMGTEGIASLLPSTCDLNGKFVFMGNRLRFNRHSVFGLGTFLPDSIRDSHDRQLMESLRPDTLNTDESAIYHVYDSIEAVKAAARNAAQLADTIQANKKKKDFVKDIMWDMVGDNIVNRIKGNFGGKDKGFYRIGPIFNPLYFSYSDTKGLVYKFDIQGRYNFTPNRFLYMRFKSGYAMKLKQFYFNIPVQFMYNLRRNANVRLEISSGQRTYNSSILEDIKLNSTTDTLDYDKMKLDYFHDTQVRLNNNYDISDNWTIQGGFVYHRRIAIDKTGFVKLGRSYKYHTFAPMIEVQFRPQGWDGPALTLNWERSFRNLFHSDMEYEKYEADASLIRKFHRMRSLSFRVGAGTYTLKTKNSYFLDFNNFRDEKIPGGWNDDWSGEFQVLRSSYYNSSNYYVRTNTTYESPLMMLSRIPIAGHYVEMERIYVSTLLAKNLHPYMEYGYGFTNRWFSMGVFVGTKNLKFDRIGCEFGFELFRKW